MKKFQEVLVSDEAYAEIERLRSLGYAIYLTGFRPDRTKTLEYSCDIQEFGTDGVGCWFTCVGRSTQSSGDEAFWSAYDKMLFRLAVIE